MFSPGTIIRHLPGRVFNRATTLIIVMLLVAAAAGAQTTTTTSVTNGSTPSGLQPGSPAGSYALSGFDNVNLYNGNLNFRLPLLNVGGRGSAGYAMVLAANLKSWHVKHTHKEWPDGSTTDSFVPTQTGWTPYSGYGAGKLTGRSYGLQVSSNLSCRWYGKTLARLTFSASDGTEYELRDQLTNGQPLNSTCNQGAYRGMVFATADGTSATFISDTAIYDIPTINPFGPTGFSVSGYLMLRDGTRYRIDGGGVTWIRDRNGNKVSFAYTSNSMTVTDSLNRTVTVNYNVSDVAPYGLCDQIIYGGFGGAQRVIRVSRTDLASAFRPGAGYTTQTLGGASGLFPELNGSSSTTYNPTVASAVWLPDGRRYRLYYNSYGELARVELPSGGAVEYDMTPGSGVFCPGPICSLPDDDAEIYRRVVERRVYPDGSTGTTFEHKDVYSNSETVGTASSTVTVEQISQGGTVLARSRHYFDGSALDSMFAGAQSSGYGAWYEGNERQTDLLETAGNIGTATVLRRTVTTRVQRAHVPWWPGAGYGPVSEEPPNDPRVIEAVTTVEPGGANLVSRQTAVDPNDSTGQTIGFDQYNNPTDTWEYDYGAGAPGGFLRRTHTDYVTASSYVTADVNPAVGASLRSLPSQQWVSTDIAGSNKVSRTDYAYDQLGLTPRAGITGQCPYYDNPGQPKGQCSATGPNGEQPTGLTARGNPTGVTRYANAAAGAGPVTATSQYDIAGNVVSTTDPKGNTTTISFVDSFCNDGVRCANTYAPNTFAFPSGVTSPVPDPTGQYGSTTAFATSTVYDYYTGLTYSTTDANNKTTTFSYKDAQNNLDPRDRLKAVVRPDGGRTDFNYGDTAGNLYVQTLSDLDAGRRTESKQFFDGLGRAYRSATYENFDAAKPWVTADTEYDALGRVKRATMPYRAAGGAAPLTQGEWSNAKRSETAYDALGRVLTVTTQPDGAVVSTSYSGNTVTVTDPAGTKRRSVSDALGRLAQVTEDPTAGGLNYVTIYTYDVLGNLRKVDQGGQLRYFMYDSLSRLTRVKNPEQEALGGLAATDPVTGNTQWSAGYAYDANGNLIGRTDARDVTTTYSYDHLNRNTQTSYAGDPSGTLTALRKYDSGVNGKGRPYLTEQSGPTTSATYIDQYDAVGQPLVLRQKFETGGVWSADYTVARTYNKAGGVLTQTYPSGRTVTYNYDAAGRPGDYNGQAAFAGNLGDGTQRTYASEVRYHELGGMEQERFGTATPVYNKSLYNGRGQLAEIRVSTYSITAPGQETNWNRGAIINHYSASGWGASGGGADNNGNPLKQEVYVPNDDQISDYTNVVQQYGYDALNRLTSIEDKPFNGSPDFYQAYSYDRWGNRTVNAAGTWNAPAPQFTASTATNRLSPPAGSTMSYDAAGNLTYDNYTGAGTRSYDAENRMTSAQDYLGQTSFYTYDADGRRVRRRVAGGSEVWQVYGIDGELLAEYAANASPATPQKEYGYRGGELLVTAEPAPSLAVGNPDFESPAVGGGYQYNPAGGTWSFASGTGVSGNSSAFTSGNPAAPEGAQVAFVQGGSTSVISQPVSGFQAGTSYSVSFKAAQRGNAGQPGQDFDLYLDATLLGTFRPADTSYAQLSTAAFTTTAGAHTLKFVGRNTSGGDNTAFIDDVRLSVAPPTQSFVTGKTLGALRADYTGHVGMKIAVGAQALTVTSLGRIYVSGNAGTHTLKVVRASDNAVVASASLSMSGGISGQFKYAPLPSPVTLAANTTYYVVSMETAGGDTWYDYYGTVLSTMSVASVVSGIYGDGVNWGIAGGAGNCYVPVDFQYQSGGGTADVRWLVADQLGTPRMVVDKTGSLAGVRRHDYLPFGEEIAADATWRTTGRGYVGDAVRQKFTGYERDPETGLDYAQARYFASAQGRFTGADPLLASARPGAPQTWNRYAYTLNNPLRFVDPSGTVEGDAQQQATQQPTPQQPPSPNPQPAPSQDQRPTNVRIDGPQPSAGLNVPTADGQFFQGYGTNLRLTPTDQNGNSIPNVTVREEVNSTLTLNGVVAPTNTLQNPAPVTSPTGVVPDLVSHGVITPARVDEGSQATREGMRSILATPTTLTQVQWLFITTPTGRVGFTVYQRTLTNVGADGTVRPYTRLSEGNFTLNRPNSIPVAPMRILCPRF